MHSFVQFQSFEISLVVYHLQKNSRNSGPFVNGTRFFNSFRWKISGKKGIYEKVVPISRWKFSQWKISKWNTNFPNFSSVPSPSRSFSLPDSFRLFTSVKMACAQVYECSVCHFLASDLQNLLHHDCGSYMNGRWNL